MAHKVGANIFENIDSMSVTSFLENVLINTYNPDHQLRVQAESALCEYLKTNGAAYQILLLVSNKAIHRDLRQAAEILLKNRLRGFWVESDGCSQMSVQEKIDFKSTILQTLLNEEDNSIKSLLADNVRIICEYEYPDSWSDLLPTLLYYIQQGDDLSKMYNSLLALRKLIKRYEFKQRSDRQILDHIIQQIFPSLQNIMLNLINNNTIESALIMKLCLKIFWSSTSYSLPLTSGVDVSFWFNTFGHIMMKPLPEGSEGIEPLGQPLDLDARKMWPWWKVCMCVYMCVQVYKYVVYKYVLYIIIWIHLLNIYAVYYVLVKEMGRSHYNTGTLYTPDIPLIYLSFTYIP